MMPRAPYTYTDADDRDAHTALARDVANLLEVRLPASVRPTRDQHSTHRRVRVLKLVRLRTQRAEPNVAEPVRADDDLAHNQPQTC